MARESFLHCQRCDAMYRIRARCCPHDGEALSLTNRDPLIGRTIDERIALECHVANGSTAVVYGGRDIETGAHAAVKMLWGEIACKAECYERFTREATAALRMNHPNIVRMIGLGTHRGWLPYTLTELVQGRTLAEVIETEGPLPSARVARIALQISLALAYVHELGLIHRDLSPINVMISNSGEPELARLFDFGAALSRDEAGGALKRLTPYDTTIGPLRYMAPEQLMKSSKTDHRADLFALGVVMYEMLSGVLPFDDAAELVAMRNATERPPPIADRAPSVRADPRLEAIAAHLMQKHPVDRPATARVVYSDLRFFLDAA